MGSLIILKIILIILLVILLAVLGIILIALLMPVRIGFGFVDGKLSYSVKYGLLNIIDSNGKGIVARLLNRSKKPKKKKADESSEEEITAPENDAPPTEEAAPICDTTVCDETESPEESPIHETSAETVTQTAEIDSNSMEEVLEQPDPTAEEAALVEEDKPMKKTLGEKVDFILRVWRSAKKPVRKIFKGFHFKDIMIELVIAHEDAYKCALRYGKVSGAVFNLLAFMRLVFTSKEKTVDVRAGFGMDKSRYDVSLRLWFMPMTAVISGAWFLLTYIFRIYLPDKRKLKKAERRSEV